MNLRHSIVASLLVLSAIRPSAISAPKTVDAILDIDKVPEEIEFRTLGPKSFTGRNGISVEATLLATAEDGSVLLRQTTGTILRTKRSSLDAASERQIADFEAKARRDGYVRWHGYWTPKEIVEAYEREQTWLEKASDLVDGKAIKNGFLEIFQVLDGHALCSLYTWDGYRYAESDIVVDLMIDDRTVAEKDRFRAPFYWVGTHTYTTVKKEEKTVNRYCFSRDFAMMSVRYDFGWLSQKQMAKVEELFGLSESDSKSDTPSRPQTGDDPQKASAQEIVGFGSGYFVTADGYFLTNFHVVKGMSKVELKTNDRLVEAQVVSTDPDNDLALLKAQGKFASVRFQRDRNVRLGQTVFTVGFPRPDLQGFSPKVTRGVVSSQNGMMDDIRQFQFDAAIQPGNSGGPIANEKGEVVGTVVSMLNSRTRIEIGDQVPQNVNYGIKKSYVLAFLDNIQSCADSIVEGGGIAKDFEEAVQQVLRSTALVVCYR